MKPPPRRALAIAIALTLAAAALGSFALAYRAWAAHRPLEWSGTVEAHTVEIGSRVGGRVLEVRAREGDLVEAGQVLVVFEAGDLPGQQVQAEGQLEQAEAALERVEAGRSPSPRTDEVAAARARLAAQEAALQQADINLKRSTQLFSGGASSRAELDAAQTAQQSATAQRDSLKEQLTQLLRSTEKDVKSARGQVAVARGRLMQIQVALGELEVRAPRRSRVETLDLRPGDLLAVNAPVARLLEPDELFIRIYVPETQLGFVRPGLEVPVSVDSFARRSFKAVVESVRHEGEFSPRNLQTSDERANQVFAARVRLEEGKDELRAGMAALVRVPR